LKSKRFYVSTGQEDTPFGRLRAATLADTIQRDLDYDEFDASLQKYRRAASPQEITPITPIEPQAPKTDLSDLWGKYSQFKKPQVSQSTCVKDYRKYSNHIAGLPSWDLKEAIAIRDYLLATLTPNAAKRTLTNINACCNWALESKLIDANPFVGMSKDIQIPKSESDKTDINPFTQEERDAIILAFEQSQLYRYYAPLVKLLFFTGCRPSEATLAVSAKVLSCMSLSRSLHCVTAFSLVGRTCRQLREKLF
jgi:integrase